MSNNSMEEAKQLLQQQKYPEAGKLFRQFWEDENNSYCASRYLFCLRKAGYPSASITQGKIAYEQFPDNIYIKNELIWAYYDAEIKVFAEEKNLNELINSANKLLTFEPSNSHFGKNRG